MPSSQDNSEHRVHKSQEIDEIAMTKTSLVKALAIAAAFVMAVAVVSLGNSSSPRNSSSHITKLGHRRLAACPLSARFEYDSPSNDYLCFETPTLFEMLYMGGSCPLSPKQSVQAKSCTDHNGGPGDRDSVYISAASNGVLLYSGTVSKTNRGFYLFNKGQLLPAPTRIEIYDDVENKTLLQDVSFDSSCDEPDIVGNVFGSSKVTGFINEGQGNVNSPDAQATPPGHVTVSLSSSSGIAVIDSVSITTDFTNPTTFSYPPMTDVEVGTQPVVASFEARLYYPAKYTTTVSVSARDGTGAPCDFSVSHVYDNTN
jgi:hypothetical protein